MQGRKKLAMLFLGTALALALGLGSTAAAVPPPNCSLCLGGQRPSGVWWVKCESGFPAGWESCAVSGLICTYTGPVCP